MRGLNYTLSTPNQIYNLCCVNYSEIYDQLHLVYDSHITSLVAQQQQAQEIVSPALPKDLLPLAVRYVSPDKNVYLIERPPFQTSIDFSASKSYNLRKPIKSIQDKTMWVPWTVTMIVFDSSQTTIQFFLYFNDGPLNALDDVLVPSFFPNSSSGNICLGNDTGPAVTTYKNTGSITELYNYFFNSYFGGWNCDLMNDIPNYNYLINDLQLVERIKRVSGQKAAKIFEKPYLYNTKNIYNRMFLLLSHMTLPEVISYISECKKTRRSVSSHFNHYIERDYVPNIPDHTEYHYRPFYSYVDQALTIAGSSTHTDHKRIRLVINNYKQEFISDYSSNPYLIYLLYKLHLESNQSIISTLNYSVDHSELLPYMNEVQDNEYSS